MSSARRGSLVLYVVLTYLTFWVLLGVTGGLMALKVPAYIIRIMQNVCAWSPTFVIIFLFKRLYPEMSLVEYFRRNFGVKVNPIIFLLILAMQAAVVFLAIGARSVLAGKPLGSISFVSASSLPALLLINMTSGPMGEELGWRGFVLRDLQKRHTAFSSALIVGVIWGFWHTPLWVISGYTGVELLIYIVSFMVGIVSLSVVITVFYNRHANILIAMWIHFLFNFLLQLTDIDLLSLIAYTSGIYLLLAVVLVIYDRRSLFRSPTHSDDANEAPA